MAAIWLVDFGYRSDPEDGVHDYTLFSLATPDLGDAIALPELDKDARIFGEQVDVSVGAREHRLIFARLHVSGYA